MCERVRVRVYVCEAEPTLVRKVKGQALGRLDVMPGPARGPVLGEWGNSSGNRGFGASLNFPSFAREVWLCKSLSLLVRKPDKTI